MDSLVKASSSGWIERLHKFSAFMLSALRPEFQLSSHENKVAYLDGLRGFAAFLVYCTHHTGFAHDREIWPIWNSYGWKDKYYFVCLPVVRLLFHGGAFAVALFFVISGYVLSLSPLNMIQTSEGDGTRLATQLGCALPRRWVRLYTPVLATTFIFMTTWKVPSWRNLERPLIVFRHLFNIESGAVEALPPTSTYAEETVRWFNEFLVDSYFFREGGFATSDYNSHIWSIATEFHGSAIIYVLLLSFFALDYTATARFFSNAGLFVYFLFLADGSAYALFVFGMVLCDLELLKQNDTSQRPRILHHFDWVGRNRWVCYIFLFCGMYLGGAPHVNDPSILAREPGWSWLAMLVPYTTTNARKYFAACGAVLTIISVPQISWLKRFFESRFCQYLGKISFGFYLIHGPVMWTVGDRLLAAVGRPRRGAEDRIPSWVNALPMSDSGPFGLEINACLPQLILFPLTLWLAGVVTKLFDQPSAVLSKRLFSPPSYKRAGWRSESA